MYRYLFMYSEIYCLTRFSEIFLSIRILNINNIFTCKQHKMGTIVSLSTRELI